MGRCLETFPKFQNTEFLKSHQDVTIYTDNKIYQYTPVLCISRKADPSLRTQPESQEDLKTYFRENYNFDIQNSDKVLV